MIKTSHSVLIDTHILIWMMTSSEQLHSLDKEQLANAMRHGQLYISAISFWEIAMLARYGRLILSIPIEHWINEVLQTPGLHVLELSIPVLLESVQLPEGCHKDPADRMIIASARVYQYPLMSYDKKIIDYAQNGYLKILAN